MPEGVDLPCRARCRRGCGTAILAKFSSAWRNSLSPSFSCLPGRLHVLLSAPVPGEHSRALCHELMPSPKVFNSSASSALSPVKPLPRLLAPACCFITSPVKPFTGLQELYLHRGNGMDGAAQPTGMRGETGRALGLSPSKLMNEPRGGHRGSEISPHSGWHHPGLRPLLQSPHGGIGQQLLPLALSKGGSCAYFISKTEI